MQLAEVFDDAEDLESLQQLKLFFDIAKGLIALNSPKLLDFLVSDHYFEHLLGYLECTENQEWVDDEGMKIAKKEDQYRAFFKREVRLVNTAGVEDPEVLQKIDVNYRLMFLRDTAAARWVEENTLSTLQNVKDV